MHGCTYPAVKRTAHALVPAKTAAYKTFEILYFPAKSWGTNSHWKIKVCTPYVQGILYMKLLYTPQKVQNSKNLKWLYVNATDCGEVNIIIAFQ